MMDRDERINTLIDKVGGVGLRLTAARTHCQSIEMAAEVINKPKPTRKEWMGHYHSFLAGWDCAMSIKHEELMDENSYLHGVVFDLCKRMCIKRCDTCKGEGSLVTKDGRDITVCPDCNQGWVDLPRGDLE